MYKKVKLKLQEAINIKNQLEKEIRDDYNLILLENTRPVGTERSINIHDYLKRIEWKEAQLLRIHIPILKANLQIPHNEEDSIANYVKRLQILETKRFTFTNLDVDSGLQVITKHGNRETVEFDSVLKLVDKNEQLIELNKEITEIKSRLALINSKIEISVELDSELNLIPDRPRKVLQKI